MTPAVGVQASEHRRARVLFGDRVSATRHVRIDEVSLELLHLLGVEDDLGELPDPGVHTVHDFLGRDLALQEGAALVDANYRVLVDRNRLPAPRHLDDILCPERVPVQDLPP